MRKVIYGGAASLDGYIMPRDGSMDWIHFSRELGGILRDFWASVDTLLIGRKTWEFAQAMGGAGKFDPAIQSYVFSRTLRAIPDKGVTLVSSDAGEFVRELKRRPGKNICVFGGGELARSLLQAGVLDEIGLNIQPVLLGGGIPVVPDTGRHVKLALAGCRELSGGCVYVTYTVKGARKRKSAGRVGAAEPVDAYHAIP